MSMSSVDYKKVRLVYMGRRINYAHKIIYLYGLQDDLSDQVCLKGRLGDYGVGALIEVFDYGSFYRPPYIGVGKFQDIGLVASWDILDTLSYCQYKAQQNWRKLESKNSEYERLIEQINELIASLPASQRKAFLFKLIADIDFKA